MPFSEKKKEMFFSNRRSRGKTLWKTWKKGESTRDRASTDPRERLWKICTVFPRRKTRGRLSTVVVVVIHGKRGKRVQRRGGFYRRELMLVLISFTVSAKVGLFFICSSTLSREWMTVEWSRLPNSRPMSSRERLVMERIRYMAICRARTASRLRCWPRRTASSRL